MKFSPETARLWADLNGRGIELQSDGETIHFRPRQTMTPALFEQVRANKSELLAWFLIQQAEALDDNLAETMIETWEERLSIMSEASGTVTPVQMQAALVQLRAMLERESTVDVDTTRAKHNENGGCVNVNAGAAVAKW